MHPCNTVVLKDIIEAFPLDRKAICTHVVSLLPKDNNRMNIDLKDARLSPSVAFDLVSSLIMQLGAAGFRQQITFLNPSESQRALLCHVIARRIAMAKQQQAMLIQSKKILSKTVST